MKIKRIEIAAFGKFKDFVMDFSDGLNVIYGGNEDGKSTVMAFIALMLYGNAGTAGRSDISKNLRKKYMPWSGEAMSGDMEIEENGRTYRIHKEFKATSKSDKVSITDIQTGEKLNLPPGMEIGKYFLGIDYQGFEKSVFALGAENFAGEENGDIAAKLSNIAESGDENISPKAALLRLEKARESFVSKRGNKGILAELRAKEEEMSEKLAVLKVKEAQKGEFKAEYEKLAAELDILHKDAEKARRSAENRKLWQRAKEYRALAKLIEESEEKRTAYAEGIHVTKADMDTYQSLVKKAQGEDVRYSTEAENLKMQKPKGTLPLIFGSVLLLLGLIGGFIKTPLFVLCLLGAGLVIWAKAVDKQEEATKQSKVAEVKAAVSAAYKELDDFIKSKNCESIANFHEAYRKGIAEEEELKALERNIAVLKETYEVTTEDKAELIKLAQDIENNLPKDDEGIDADEIDRKIREKNQSLLDIKGRLGEEVVDIGALENEFREVCENRKEAEAQYKYLTLAAKAMAETADEMSRSFAPKLRDRASALLERITKGRYSALSISKTYDIEIKTGEAGAYREWQYLSKGTCAQSYLALRLAVCELLCNDGVQIPLILDDILSDYDNERERAAAGFLEEYADEGRQVLFFTCHNWKGKASAKSLIK